MTLFAAKMTHLISFDLNALIFMILLLTALITVQIKEHFKFGFDDPVLIAALGVTFVR